MDVMAAAAEKEAAKTTWILEQAHADSIEQLRRTPGGRQQEAVLSQTYDRQQSKNSYESVIGLTDQYKQAGEALKNAFKEGDETGIAKARQELMDIRAELQKMLPDAKAFALAMGDQKMIAALQQVDTLVKKTQTDLVKTKDVNQQLATGLVGVFDKGVTALENLDGKTGRFRDVLKAVGIAFEQFAADFLKKIAEMILQQELLNLLSKSPLGSLISKATNALADKGIQVTQATSQVTVSAAEAGANAFAATAAIPVVGPELAPAAEAAAEASVLGTFLPQVTAALAHSGDVVGSPGGQSRSVAPEVFANAMRYHTGGIAGLLPNEVPTILQRDEEVLTTSNPHHIFNQNGGGSGSAGAAPAQNVKIVNAFDHATVLSEGLSTDVGQRAIVNFVRKNRRAMNNALQSG